jgi:hypothetical protein
MVQRIQKSANIAVSYIYEGELARQNTAGFFYACTLNKYSVTPVWKVNASTALVVYDNRSVALFFCAANRTIFSAMSYTETTCLAGNNSTQQATDAHETGLKQIVEIAYHMSLWHQPGETRDRLKTMFFEWLKFAEDLDSEQVRETVWCFEDLNNILDHIEKLEKFKGEMHDMLYPNQNINPRIGTLPNQLTIVN